MRIDGNLSKAIHLCIPEVPFQAKAGKNLTNLVSGNDPTPRRGEVVVDGEFDLSIKFHS